MAVNVGTAQGKLTLDGSQFISTISKAYDELNKLNKMVDDTQKSINELSGKNIDLNISGNNVGGGSFVGMEAAGMDFDWSGFQNNTKKSADSVNVLSEALKTGLGGALKGVGALAETTFTAFIKYTEFIASFVKDSLNVGMAFDAGMSQVQAITGATEEDFDSLRAKAIELGADTKFSASEAAEAMKYMGMAGWKTEEVLSGISGVMSLAAASGEDLASTSDIVTDALTAFGLGADKASEFADVLAAAATNSNTNVALMGETFKYVASMAGTMHYSIQDTAVAIGLMANNGVKGSQAGTALRNVITNLAKPTKQVKEAMDNLGISLVDSEGNTKDLMSLMQDLRSAFKGLSVDPAYLSSLNELNSQYENGKISAEEYEEQSANLAESFAGSLETIQAKYAATISGKYGLSGLLAIVNATDEDFAALTDTIYNASEGMGAAADMEETMMNNLQGSVTQFSSTLESFKIAVSDTFKGSANEFVKFGREAISGMTKALQEEGIPGLIRSIGGIIPEAVNLIVQCIPQVLPALIDGFWALIQGVIAVIPQALPTIIDGAIQLFLGLVTGLADAVDVLVEMLPDIIDQIVNGLLNNSDAILDAAFRLFGSLAEGLVKAIPQVLKGAVQLIKKFVAYLKEHFTDILKVGMELVGELISGLLDPEVLKDLIVCVGEIIKVLIDAFLQTDWLQVASDVFSGLGEGLLGIFEGACGAIDEIFGTNLKGWAEGVSNWFRDVKRASFEFGASISQAIHKTDTELNALSAQYNENYVNMLYAVNAMRRQGIDELDAMRAAFQEYFSSAEAQYVFRERFADQLRRSDAYSDIIGDVSNQKVADYLSEKSSVSNIYNFYTNEPIDEKKAADEIREVNETLGRWN